MKLHGSAKLIVSIVFALCTCLKVVENSIEAPYYRSVRQASLRDFQVLNDTIYEDGLAHLEINELNPDISKIRIIEDDYRNLLAMKSTKYIFQRLFYWRTWREVADIEGKSKFVCYRCQTIFNVTCKTCNCGYWEIEESPPCPFEIFSVINQTHICVAFYNQLKNLNSNCPSIISFVEMGKCDNPLETRWRIINKSTDVSERSQNVICKEREICEFSTIFSILPDSVTFKIINSTNNMIYSKVMRNGNMNYAYLNTPVTHNKSRSELSPVFSIKADKSYEDGESTMKDLTTHISIIIKKKRIKNQLTTSTSKGAIRTSTLHCKHLQATPSEEEYYDGSENNEQ